MLFKNIHQRTCNSGQQNVQDNEGGRYGSVVMLVYPALTYVREPRALRSSRGRCVCLLVIGDLPQKPRCERRTTGLHTTSRKFVNKHLLVNYMLAVMGSH